MSDNTHTIQVVAGSIDVISSGSLFLANGENAFLFIDRGINEFKIEISFESRDNVESPQITLVTVGALHQRVIAINFTSPFGTGTSMPLYVANSKGRRVLLHFYSSLVGVGEASFRLVHYQMGYGGAP